MQTDLRTAIHSLIVTVGVLIFVIAPATGVSGQLPIDPFSTEKPEPVRVDLGGGKHKLVYKDRAGVISKEEIFENTGSMFNSSRKVQETLWYEKGNGKGKSITIRTFGEDPNTLDMTKDGPVIKQEATEYDAQGNPVERIVYEAEAGRRMNIDYRTITRWTPGSGPNGITHREKFDREQGQYVVIKTSPYAGKWRLVANGKQQLPGEYTFEESPGVAVLRHDSKVWLLVLGLKSDLRTVALPAESKDHLGFSKRLIQLRGDANTGRLEFWLTPDLTVGEFQRTSYELVRETQ